MNALREHLDMSADKISSNIIEEEDESSTTEITKPFDPTKIDITVKPLIIDSLIKRMQSKPPRIDLNTEFQRLGNLWKSKEQSRLIESLLVRIPMPAFYFDGTDDNFWKVVDGLQRLCTFQNFVINKTLKLSNLEYLKQYDGYSFDDLPSFLKGRIEETGITAYIINPGTPPEVKYNLFKRINTGGISLTPQEIRHALNQGIPADFVKELASLAAFKKATSYAINKRRMQDRDFVTRFIGFYLDYENYQPDLDSFLHNAMSKLNKLSESAREQIKKDFIKAMRTAYYIFQNDAFRKRYSSNEPRNPLNKALFDAWSVNLAKLPENKLDKLIEMKAFIKKQLISLMDDEKFYDAISSSTGDINAVRERFRKIKLLIDEALNAKQY